ncbi:MAG: WG repeat-containing protein [Deltaproteobacteria bacterium]|nr:WG repeat-containing protein [Candidatus Zymogenaceae bacterium]
MRRITVSLFVACVCAAAVFLFLSGACTDLEMAIPVQFDKAGNFSEGLAVVVIGDKYGYIDKMGDMPSTPGSTTPALSVKAWPR